jgi:Leucine-rich repeat (LRR) protein
MSSVTEELLLELTDCEHLEDIRVVSLRNRNIKQCLKCLTGANNLNILYLQNNQVMVKDLTFLHAFAALKKIDLSDNQLDSLPQG